MNNNIYKCRSKASYHFVSLLLSLCISLDAFANRITVVTEHLAPFQIVESNSITGLSTEIVKATLDKAGYKYSIEAYPWSMSYTRATKEENVCIYSLARLPERSSLFQWVGHITTSSISLYALSNNPISISRLDDAKKYKVAVMKDDVTHQFLLSKGFEENKNLYVMTNYDALLKLLETPSRQIDLVVLNDDLINSRIKSKDEANKYINVYKLKDLDLDFYFACSSDTEVSIVNHLVNTMKQLEQSGVNSKIRDKWHKTMVNIIN